jgi:hypothetical protein
LDWTKVAMIMGALAASAAVAGCTNGYDSQAAAQPLRLAGTDGYKAFDAALTVLGEMHFTIDKADPNTGIIRTRPLPAAQFFELWRSDNVTLTDQLEANLHSLRRTAWLTIATQGTEVVVDCLVRVQRLNVPSHAVPSSATAYRSLSESTDVAQSLRLSAGQQHGMEWTDLSTDLALANRILARIDHHVKKTGRRGLHGEG